MNLALALLLSTASPAQTTLPPNLDLGMGSLVGWEGDGFYVTNATGRGPSRAWGICSSDRGKPGQKGLVYRTFVIPPGASAIRFTAYAARPKDCAADENLDVVLQAAGNKIIPKQIRSGTSWKPVATLLSHQDGRPREYIWSVAAYGGQRVRIAVVDEDARPGCHVFCSGFHILSTDEFEGKEFARFMVHLVKKHQLPPADRFDSKHFMAISNAGDPFSEHRLHNCELIYELFYDHFRSRGFKLHKPMGKLMVAIFDSQAGFEAYLGSKMPPGVTGVYNRETNRLLVYDYGLNEAFLAHKRQGILDAQRIRGDLDRQRYIDTVNRKAQEYRTETNIGTIMHEVAHQLSFNSGLLNREGDVPLWLAEGLACYCEATDNTCWQGIGEPNPERLFVLAAILKNNGRFIPLKELVGGDLWMHGRTNEATILAGYAQSWALFRMLMQERPAELRAYLRLIYARRTPDHRLADFGQAFGADLARLELRLGEYVKDLVERHYRPRR